MAQSDEPRTVKSVDKTFQLIRTLRESESSTVTELSEALGLTPGTVHVHLATLKKHKVVVQDGHEYALGPKLLAYGEYVRNHSGLYQAARDQVGKLARETGECSHLLIDYNGQLYALYERFGENAVGVKYHDYKREKPINHLHCTAAGKAILAHKPEAETQEFLSSRDFPANTPNTMTDVDVLLEEFQTIRERGYAFADEEQMQGIRAVGTAIQNPAGDILGAITISGPTRRMEGETFREEYPNKVTQAANICEVNLQTDSLEDAVM